jgi:hypothetical protein
MRNEPGNNNINNNDMTTATKAMGSKRSASIIAYSVADNKS